MRARHIFAVAVGPLEVKGLRHDYGFTLPSHDTEGKISKFTGWFAEVKMRDGALLRFALVSEPLLCHCVSSWRGYTLAAPKKKWPLLLTRASAQLDCVRQNETDCCELGSRARRESTSRCWGRASAWPAYA